MVRLMNSGTEATTTAVRLARGYTGRDRFVIFHGNFHGATDALLAAGGSGVATLGLPGTAGVPASAVAEHAGRAVQRGAAAGRRRGRGVRRTGRRQHGRRRPGAGFLEGLRAECDRVGALLVFDEVITGFRLGTGGAQAKYDVRADLTTFGKVIGGGLPIGAVGGRREHHGDLSPLGQGVPRRHAGRQPDRHRGRPRRARPADARRLHRAVGPGPPPVGGTCATRAAAAGLPAQFPVVGTLVGMYFGDGPAPDRLRRGQDHRRSAAYGRFFHAMLREGVALAPGAYEALFVGLAHTDDVLDEIAAAAHRAATEATEATETSETSDLSA